MRNVYLADNLSELRKGCNMPIKVCLQVLRSTTARVKKCRIKWLGCIVGNVMCG